MEMVLIKHIPRYEDYEEIIGIAISMDVAKEHVKDLKKEYPHAYNDECGRFSFEEYKVIEE